ncbi:MAG: VCBS domain-containing protein [Pseudomonadota bacterium]
MVAIRNILTGFRGGVSLPAGARFTALNLTLSVSNMASASQIGQVEVLAEQGPLIVVEVEDLGGNVGQPVTGDGGGLFTLSETGEITFDPAGEFDTLGTGETAETSVHFAVTDGISTDEAIVTVTVLGAAGLTAPQVVGMIPDQQDPIAA